MQCYCLIPTTRTDFLAEAVQSAVRDGWIPVVLADPHRRGPSQTREALLENLEGDSLIRYCDDDDIVLTHQDSIQKVFESDPSLDVIYMGHLMKSRLKPNVFYSQSYSGDPLRDLMGIHPWSWVARLSSLRKVQKLQGYVWNPEFPCREGGFCWLGFLSCALKIRYLDIAAYQYNGKVFDNCVSNHSDFHVNSVKLRNMSRHLSELWSSNGSL